MRAIVEALGLIFPYRRRHDDSTDLDEFAGPHRLRPPILSGLYTFKRIAIRINSRWQNNVAKQEIGGIGRKDAADRSSQR